MGAPSEGTSKHVPMRRCVVCRASRPQGELERFYQLEGVWRHDPKRRAGGRGSWVCVDNPACHKTKALRRAFRAQAEAISGMLQTLAEAQTPHPANTKPLPAEPRTQTHQGGTNA